MTSPVSTVTPKDTMCTHVQRNEQATSDDQNQVSSDYMPCLFNGGVSNLIVVYITFEGLLAGVRENSLEGSGLLLLLRECRFHLETLTPCTSKNLISVRVNTAHAHKR